MIYVTVPQSPIYHQISLEELLSGNVKAGIVRSNESNTRTYLTDKPLDKLYKYEDVIEMIYALQSFVERHADLYAVEDRHQLYHQFCIPKKTGGLRQINAPNPELKSALYELVDILRNKCKALYHTAAFAYVDDRDTVRAVQKHQQNQSHWFLKIDFHDFFGSTTKQFALATLEKIAPFNMLMSYSSGREALSKALDLGFLDGGLPQGTPLSPMLTNLLMIPIDYTLSKALRDFNGQSFVYTRYADDMLISSFKEFKYRQVLDLVRDTLEKCEAPFTFNDKKTRYASSAGSNWNLGLMLNKDNEITIGHRNKKYFRAMLTNYILDKQHGRGWPIDDVRTLLGKCNYYLHIEEDYFNGLINSMNAKYKTDVVNMMKSDIKIG